MIAPAVTANPAVQSEVATPPRTVAVSPAGAPEFTNRTGIPLAKSGADRWTLACASLFVKTTSSELRKSASTPSMPGLPVAQAARRLASSTRTCSEGPSRYTIDTGTVVERARASSASGSPAVNATCNVQEGSRSTQAPAKRSPERALMSAMSCSVAGASSSSRRTVSTDLPDCFASCSASSFRAAGCVRRDSPPAPAEPAAPDSVDATAAPAVAMRRPRETAIARDRDLARGTRGPRALRRRASLPPVVFRICR